MSEELPILLTAHDVGSWLGLPTRRVIRLARDRVIPALTLPGGELAFDRRELARWIETCRAAHPEGGPHNG